MKKLSWHAHQYVGLLVTAFGLTVTYRWIFQSEFIARLIPHSVDMALNSPLLLTAGGICCMLLPLQPKHPPARSVIVRLCAAFMLLWSSLIMVQHIFGVSLGIDFVRVPTLPTEDIPHPGRVAPNTCIAFFCAGLALFLASRPQRSRTQERLLSVLVAIVMVLGFSALAGRFLQLETLYRIASFNGMLAPTAFGVSMLGLALGLLRQQMLGQTPPDVRQQAISITYRSISVLTLVALSAGIAGYSVMREIFEKGLAENILLAATTNASSLTNTLEDKLTLHRTIANRPVVQSQFAALKNNPQSAQAIEVLRQTNRNLMTTGLSGARLYDSRQTQIASNGVLLGEKVTLAHPLKPAGSRTYLLWEKGYLLHTETPVTGTNGEYLGSIVAEQRLPAFDKLLQDIRSSGASTDVLICSRNNNAAVCAPTRFYNTVFSIPMFKADGTTPNLPINRALLGETGVLITKDLRKIPVFAAYTPLKQFDLGMVVKTDTETLYAPLKGRVKLLAVLLIALVAAGTLILRLQVRPLLKHIVREQRRIKVILENSKDAFVALGIDGLITDWNGEAERTFGWSAQEAIGRRLSELIIPPAQRAAHDAGFERFAKTGTGAVINNRIEVMALHRDGRELPVELSIAAFYNGHGYIAHAFIRDITERKQAEEKLASSERRLRAISDNLPALISYVDQDQNYHFYNKTFVEWFGVAPVVDGKISVREVLGPRLYEERRDKIERALAGERVEFEIETEAVGMRRNLRSVYVPDFDASGKVVGIYTLSSDVTELKTVEKKLTQLARYDTLTGLPNRHHFNDKLVEAMARCRRSASPMALMFLDVDHFKSINDTYGHGAGDAVLREFATRLASGVRVTDTVARLAGDEFTIILEQLHNQDEARMVGEKVVTAIRAPFKVQGHELQVSTSIGIAYFLGGEMTPDALMERADQALYQAKEAGRNTYRLMSA